jgi:hypothetical protein
MKAFTFLFLALSLVLLYGCSEDTCVNEQTYTVYHPVYVHPDTIDKEIILEPARPLKAPGKIYFYNDYIFINEPFEGFHIINNSVPSAPINERFVKLEGNVDLAVINDYLYADAYTDLVVVDLHNMNKPTQINRKPDVFKSQYEKLQSGAFFSHYKNSKVTTTIDCNHPYWGREYYSKDGNLNVASGFDPSVGGNGGVIPGGAVGKGGSLARFTISKEHLYVVGTNQLYTISVGQDGSVSEPTVTDLPWGIETIFPYQDFLLVGANNGMHLISIADPANPQIRGKFDHARSCDPVVAENDIAYVTLRNGTECQGYINQLEIIDVKNVEKPTLLHTIPMDHPHGLAVEEDYLYLCEGIHGLKVFKTTDLANIKSNQVGSYNNFHAWDVISLKGHSLLVIGNDGFRQYDHNDPTNLKLISTIPVQN